MSKKKKELYKWANKYRLWLILHGNKDNMDCRSCKHFTNDVPGWPVNKVFNNCTWERVQYDYQKHKAYLGKRNYIGSFCIEWIKYV